MITKFGKRFLTDFVAGNVSFANKDLAIGIANSIEYPLSTSNSRLGFEFYRLPIKFGGIDIDTSVSPAKYTAIFSATLPPNMSGKINELGIYPSNRTSKNNYDSRFISDFELPYDWSDTPNLDQTNYRVGDSSLTFISNGASSKEYKSTISGFDLVGYSNLDSLSLSYKVNDSNLNSIKVRFYSTSSDYFEFIFDDNSQGYHIQSINLSEMTTFGSPDKANINTLGITVVPSESQSSVSLDGLRINDEDTFDPSYGLIARSILDSEIEKVFGREMFIEFKLDVAFGD
jgi:hypothetical protein